VRNTGSEDAVANAGRKAQQRRDRLDASRPERHAAMQRAKRAV
jgi:hypothetical protein